VLPPPPPPVPPVPPPPDGVVAPPPPDGALPPEGVVPPEGAVDPLDGVVAPLEGVVAPLPVVAVVLVDELLELVVVCVLEAIAWLGTVNAGASTVSAVELSPPPQAARPTPSPAAAMAASRNLGARATGWVMPTNDL